MERHPSERVEGDRSMSLCKIETGREPKPPSPFPQPTLPIQGWRRAGGQCWPCVAGCWQLSLRIGGAVDGADGAEGTQLRARVTEC